jgi:DNA-binding XRE family transcriptional regulator
MKKATLATAFAELRQQSGLSMLAVANKCDISETTVWKLENGRSTRWETVHLILTVGMNIPDRTERYAAFQALWVKARQEMAESQGPDFGTPKMPAHAAAAVRKFRKIVTGMNEQKLKKLMATVTQSASRLK